MDGFIYGEVVGAGAVQAEMRDRLGRIRTSVRNAVRILTLELLRKVKEEKLTGQVLNVRTGRLKRSINARFMETEVEIRGSVGTNLDYGIGWELGFEIKPYIHKNLFGKGIVAQMPGRSVAARPYLQPSLEEMRDRVVRQLGLAAKEGTS